MTGSVLGWLYGIVCAGMFVVAGYVTWRERRRHGPSPLGTCDCPICRRQLL